MFFERFWPSRRPEAYTSQGREAAALFEPGTQELLSREIEDVKPLQREGAVSVVKLKDDGKGVFKTESGVTRDPNLEQIAYLVDRILGFHLVPTTVMRRVSGRKGSLQYFVEDAKTEYEMTAGAEIKEEMITLGLFDYIIGNVDRNGGNWLVAHQKVWAIDHGMAFDENPVRICGTDRLVGREIPQKLRARLLEFFTQHGEETLHTLLVQQLGKKNARNVMRRLQKVRKFVEQGKFPGSVQEFAIV